MRTKNKSTRPAKITKGGIFLTEEMITKGKAKYDHGVIYKKILSKSLKISTNILKELSSTKLIENSIEKDKANYKASVDKMELENLTLNRRDSTRMYNEGQILIKNGLIDDCKRGLKKRSEIKTDLIKQYSIALARNDVIIKNSNNPLFVKETWFIMNEIGKESTLRIYSSVIQVSVSLARNIGQSIMENGLSVWYYISDKNNIISSAKFIYRQLSNGAVVVGKMVASLFQTKEVATTERQGIQLSVMDGSTDINRTLATFGATIEDLKKMVRGTDKETTYQKIWNVVSVVIAGPFRLLSIMLDSDRTKKEKILAFTSFGLVISSWFLFMTPVGQAFLWTAIGIFGFTVSGGGLIAGITSAIGSVVGFALSYFSITIAGVISAVGSYFIGSVLSLFFSEKEDRYTEYTEVNYAPAYANA